MSDLQIVITFDAVMLLIFVRNYITATTRISAIRKCCDQYLTGPGYFAMMLDLRKWTFEQFYPNAGKSK